jgi:hypothetical protein
VPNPLKRLDWRQNGSDGTEPLKRGSRAYWQSARALVVHCPKPLATMLRMTEQT